jgi:hypothetical protein
MDNTTTEIPPSGTVQAPEAIPTQRETPAEAPVTQPAVAKVVPAAKPARTSRRKVVLASAATCGVLALGMAIGAGAMLVENTDDISRLEDRVAALTGAQAALADTARATQNELIRTESAFGFSREHLSRLGNPTTAAVPAPAPVAQAPSDGLTSQERALLNRLNN